MSVYTLLIVIALVLAIVSGVVGRVPLWISVVLICIAQLVGTRVIG